MERGGPNAAHIAELANAAFASNTPFYGWPPIQRVPPVQRVEPPTPIDLAAKITVVYPKGQSLPESFLQQDWSAAPDRWRYPACLTAKLTCDAMVLDIDGDGAPEVLIFYAPSGFATAYKQTNGKWSLLGIVTNSNCRGVREGLSNGKVELVEIKQLQVAGQRLFVAPGCR
jgi:hypothetical protein